MPPRYKVTLTQKEREGLEVLTKNGKTTAPSFVHARALLLCDAGEWGDPWTVADVAAALGVTSRTIEHLKERFVEEGLEADVYKRQGLVRRGSPPWPVRRPRTGAVVGRCACWPKRWWS